MAMQMGSPGARPGRVEPNMNVTPLVDVVLVLLIIFMVITPLLAKQFWVHLPNPVESTPPSLDDHDQPIVVRVTRAGEILINREAVPKPEFALKLKRVLAASGQRTVFFDAEEDSEFGLAVEVLDLARGGGAATIAVLTEPLAPATP